MNIFGGMGGRKDQICVAHGYTDLFLLYRKDSTGETQNSPQGFMKVTLSFSCMNAELSLGRLEETIQSIVAEESFWPK